MERGLLCRGYAGILRESGNDPDNTGEKDAITADEELGSGFGKQFDRIQ